MAPGQPHFLAGGVEGHRQSGQDTVLGTQRCVGQEDARLGIHEGCGRTVGDGHALGFAGGTGSEDHPGIVLRLRGAGGGERGRTLADDGDPTGARDMPGDRRFLEDHPGTLIGVIGIHRDIGGPDPENGQDPQVQLGGARGDPHADLVPGTQPGLVQLQRVGLDLGDQLGVPQDPPAVIDGRGIRIRLGGGLQEFDQGTGSRGQRAARELRGMAHGGGLIHDQNRSVPSLACKAGTRCTGGGRCLWSGSRRGRKA